MAGAQKDRDSKVHAQSLFSLQKQKDKPYCFSPKKNSNSETEGIVYTP